MDESKGLNLEELLRPVEKAHETIACKAECRVGILHPLLYTRGSWPRKNKEGRRVGGYNSSTSIFSYGQPESRNGESAESNESQIILICYFL